MKYAIFIPLFILLSFSTVFAIKDSPYIVVNKSENLCGVFQKGSGETPNWLQIGWEAIIFDTELNKESQNIISCENNRVTSCCKSLGYKFAGVPIGEGEVSEERVAAEYLAEKGLIEVRSLNPHKYRLDEYITRKETMKLISGISKTPLSDRCIKYYLDMPNDWSCKYISSLYELQYISANSFFRPDEFLGYAEALKLVFKAQTIEKSYETASWEEEYISSSLYKGFIDFKPRLYQQEIKRGELFQIIARTYPDFSYSYLY